MCVAYVDNKFIENQIKILNLTNGELVRTLNGHSRKINSLVLLPNAQIASASDDETIKIWDLETGNLIRILIEHTGNVNVLSVNGWHMASGSNDDTVKVWDATDWKLVGNFKTNNSIELLTVLSNGRIAFTSTFSDVIIYGNFKNTLTKNGRNTEEIRTDSRISALAALPSGYLACATTKAILIVDLDERKLIRKFSDHQDSIETLTVLSDGNLASGSNVIYVSNPNDGSVVQVLREKDAPRYCANIVSIAALADGYLANTFKYGYGIRLWDTTNGHLIREVPSPNATIVIGLPPDFQVPGPSIKVGKRPLETSICQLL